MQYLVALIGKDMEMLHVNWFHRDNTKHVFVLFQNSNFFSRCFLFLLFVLIVVLDIALNIVFSTSNNPSLTKFEYFSLTSPEAWGRLNHEKIDFLTSTHANCGTIFKTVYITIL